MPFSDQYEKQVRLLLRAIPLVAKEKCFALVGGTAINLFVRDLPRLSVDIDLHYLPVHERTESLREIDAALKRIAESIKKSIPSSGIHKSKLDKENAINKLIVRLDGVQIKIEVTPVLRGAVYEPEIRPVTIAVEEDFGFAEIQVVSFADLYAGKIVAVLDRQHPRGEPDWRLLGLKNVANLPAIRWKQLNLDKLDAERRGEFGEGSC